MPNTSTKYTSLRRYVNCVSWPAWSTRLNHELSSPYIEEYIQQPTTCKLHGYRNQEYIQQPATCKLHGYRNQENIC